MGKAKAAVAGGYFDALPVDPNDVRELTASASSQSVSVSPMAVYYLVTAGAVRYATGAGSATASGSGNYARLPGAGKWVVAIPRHHDTLAYIRDGTETANVTCTLEGTV